MVWFALSYAAAILGFLGLYAVASRWLGPRDFGLFVGAMTAAGLLGQLGLVGSHRAGLREVARLRDHDDPVAMAVLRNGVRAVCLTTLPAVGLLGAVGAFVVAGDGEHRWLLAAGVGAVVVLGAQQQLWANYVRGLGHIRFASLLEGRSGGALVALLQTACLCLTWWLFPGSGLGGALVAVACGLVLPVIAARAVVQRHWAGLSSPWPRLLTDLRHVVDRDWRFLSSQVATYLNTSVEIWIAALVLSRVDTSMFSAGQRLALMLLLPLTALQVVFAPVIARIGHADRDDPTLHGLVQAGASVSTAVCLLLALPIVVAPGFVIALAYGPGFAAAVPVLLLLSVGTFGNVATGMAGTTLSMLGREGVTARVQWTGAVLRVVLGAPAALVGGLAGLTVSALSVSIFVFTAMWWSTYRCVGVFTHATLRPELRLLRRTPG